MLSETLSYLRVKEPNFIPTARVLSDEAFSLSGLSPQARKLAYFVLTQPRFFNDLHSLFLENPEQAWSVAEEQVGSLTESDRSILQTMSQVFLPDSRLHVSVFDGGDGGCWAMVGGY